MFTSRPTVLLAALLLPLTACSGSGDDEKAAKAISDSIMESQEKQTGNAQMFAMPREDADCIGEGFVDEIGTEQLQEYGFLTEDLKASEDFTNVEMSKEDAGAAADTLLECADVQEMLTKAMGDQIDAKTRECFEGVLTEDALRSLFTKMFSGQQEEAGRELVQPMMECAAPDLQDQ
ncbi:MAG TPA: hypothetical protein VFV40_06145 [Nocardioides sp.]|nr:hypothetical protein [Nocardioides sp.]